MKFALPLIFSLFALNCISLVAQANTQTCSNSNQTLVYTQRTGSTATLKYEQLSQHQTTTSDAALDFHLSSIEVKQQQKAGAAMLKTTTALAQGSIQDVAFRDWVVCSELVQ